MLKEIEVRRRPLANRNPLIFLFFNNLYFTFLKGYILNYIIEEKAREDEGNDGDGIILLIYFNYYYFIRDYSACRRLRD